ncbi:hypothetical protein FPW20_07405 [Vibrio cholerae]|uniref:hypothetical protein n=1 Tax=Vibrio cholerae TaxID=666 RepID=UPI001182753C|nr:hypothetical protein [Vibrio cholerae]TVN18857.1 hypothetical protein FPW20_07405 [Vibrio cholerae]
MQLDSRGLSKPSTFFKAYLVFVSCYMLLLVVAEFALKGTFIGGHLSQMTVIHLLVLISPFKNDRFGFLKELLLSVAFGLLPMGIIMYLRINVFNAPLPPDVTIPIVALCSGTLFCTTVASWFIASRIDRTFTVLSYRNTSQKREQ